MKIALTEIGNFLSLVGKEEKGWSYSLHAGQVTIDGISTEAMHALQNDEHYDTELLPSIFTFREILWQPDVFTEAAISLPPLRILKAFCAEIIVELEDHGGAADRIYISLVKGIGKCTSKAIKEMEKEKSDVKRILGNFRTCAFPIIKFFIYHPKNREDYLKDAINRLNYAVKIMLTQFYGRYSDLADPYWEIKYSAKKPEKLQNKRLEQ